VRLLISKAATKNHAQCRNTSIPAKRNRRSEPFLKPGIHEIYIMHPGCYFRNRGHIIGT